MKITSFNELIACEAFSSIQIDILKKDTDIKKQLETFFNSGGKLIIHIGDSSNGASYDRLHNEIEIFEKSNTLNKYTFLALAHELGHSHNTPPLKEDIKFGYIEKRS